MMPLKVWVFMVLVQVMPTHPAYQTLLAGGPPIMTKTAWFETDAECQEALDKPLPESFETLFARCFEVEFSTTNQIRF